MKNLNAIKETKKSFIVDLDSFNNRNEYYQNSFRNVKIRFEKAVFTLGQLTSGYNDYFETTINALTAFDKLKDYFSCPEIYPLSKGVHVYRKGYKVI